MNETEILYDDNDMVIELRNLKDESAGTFVNNADVTVTLKDSSGVSVVGDTWPLSMPYVTSSNGVYRATLVDTLSVTPNASYTAIVSADGGVGKQGTWNVDVKCKTRR